ncbi:MAG: sigma-54-dependent Fis family transcriptional regulator [Planctomycetes bacterium]|nr:sigma-54-dependent Fis family transcriptional regulator [Planctomycetota bacterium]
MTRVLIIDDELIMRDALAAALRRAGHEVAAHVDPRAALEQLAAEDFHVVLTDLRMPGMDGQAVLEEARRLAPDVPIIMITAHGAVRDAVAAMKAGAYDFLGKPIDLDELEAVVTRAARHRALTAENEVLRARLDERELDYVWDASPAMRAAMETLRRVAASDATVLICGETGTGKEVAARTIHRLSARRAGPFLAVNSAALSAGLLESELFGHEKGAFTGADRMRRGRFELAEGGTLLLDEVSEIDLALQAKLLRVLQERAFERVGSSVTRRCNVRVIATTNRDLRAEVGRGRFREDLYYRLNVLPVRLPPLRERREEIPALAEHFLKRFGARKRISAAALDRMHDYDWPGNVRELGNVIERAIVLSPGEVIDEDGVGPCLEGRVRRPDVEGLAGLPLDEIEDRLIVAAVERCGGNRERAARELGISSRTLRDRLKKT